MENSDSANSQGSSNSKAPQDMGFSPWQRLKSKRISYLTLPLLIMATVTEFVILATGWRYQQVVCLPKGMGVTLFGIGPIGATIPAVELLKLPLAIWTASRRGWHKGLMLIVGLPLICLLTFQLVKDMAVYEMGVALTPASQFYTQATELEVKSDQLKGELAAIDQKKATRDTRLAEVAAKMAKAKTDLAESIKRNEEARQDAISLTDYQKKELSDVDSREGAIIKQFNADTEQLTKKIADLHARRDVLLPTATKWNAEEARIDNAYKTKLADYTNKKAAYEKDKKDYDNAGFLRRAVMSEPVDPGVPPVREVNTILQPVEFAELDAQIKAKEAELTAVNGKRREQVAQVEADAHRLRQEFDVRSSSKREESDHKREELSASLATLVAQGSAEAKQINTEYDAAAGKVDAIRAEFDDCQKKAEGFYEAREAAIKSTQVHRIATTVEIVRGLLKGQRPISIKATAKERGDLYTDQISMVRIWVYPVLAFIVAFLPTLMVEIGFTTLFEPEPENEKKRRAHRLGFMGRRMHWVYIRAGRLKILRAERLASEAMGQITGRDRAVAEAKASAERVKAEAKATVEYALAEAKAVTDHAQAEKETALQAAHQAMSLAVAEREGQLKRKEEEYAAELKGKEEEWVAKIAGMADSLHRAVVEKDALRDLQKSEIERQIQMRQNAWSDRLTHMRQELDDQRTAAETERTTLMQEQHKKLMEVTEDSKTQVIQARRQAADAELTAVEATSKLTHDLTEALRGRDAAESQLKQQADAFALRLSQAKEDTTREIEKAARQEKHRVERMQLEFTKTLGQREEDLERQLKLREEQLLRRESELEHELETQSREAEARLKQELLQKEVAFQAKLKQREQELAMKATTRETELNSQWATDLRAREEEWQLQAEARVRDTETRLDLEAKQKEEAAHARFKQREQDLATQLTAQMEARQTAAHAEWVSETEFKTRAAVEPFKALLARTEKERDEAIQAASEGAHQVQNLEKKLTEASTFLSGWRNGKKLFGAAS